MLGTSGPPRCSAASLPQGESALRADRRAQRTPFFVMSLPASDLESYPAEGHSLAHRRREIGAAAAPFAEGESRRKVHITGSSREA